MPDSDKSENEPGRSGGWWPKLVVLAIVVATFAVVYIQFGDRLNLDYLADKETELRSLKDDYPLLIYVGAFIIYVVVTGLSIPGAAILSLVFAWYFGFFQAVVLVSFASTSGATLAFLLSRFLFRDIIHNRFGERLTKFNEALQREGPFFLFMLRLVPLVPFFVINLVMGLTPIRTRTFWWVSQIGMLPGTAVFCYAGASVPNLSALAENGAGGILTLNVVVAFVVLGVFPFVVRFLVKRFRPDGIGDSQTESVAHSNQEN